jgi:hypothetical protein
MSAIPTLQGWVMDPNAGAQQMAQMLEKGEHPLQVERGVGPIEFIAHSQDNGSPDVGGGATAWMRRSATGGWSMTATVIFGRMC